MRNWHVSAVADYLDFSCGGRFGDNPSLVELQNEGVSRICSILRREAGVAYLADEVGLGKTMQAYGVIACLFADKPDARVLVITPREVVQNGWKNEYARFQSFVARQSANQLSSFGNLREWLRDMPGPGSISLLRHPSFSRPVFENKGTWKDAVTALDLPDIDFRAAVATNQQDASWDHNMAFAADVNAWLAREGARFDLVVVDEAQCLRNLEGQQTNSVLRRLLQDRVDRWLFLSATPAHSGAANIATVMNAYPGKELVTLTDDSEQNAVVLKKAMKRFMVRRPRTFTVQDQRIHKWQYRLDDDTRFAMHCKETLDILSIALVQKKLVGMLGSGDGYRFRTGYIASFESLEDSLRSQKSQAHMPKQLVDGEEVAPDTDFAGDRHFHADPGGAVDEGFVTRISEDFRDTFKIGLPHPKVDGVEQELASAVWGDGAPGNVGGQKTVVFCRRLSSVRILRERLMNRYLHAIEARCRSTWNFALDWEKGLSPLEQRPVVKVETQEDVSGAKVEDIGGGEEDTNRLRTAQQPGKWLYNFRASFSDGQRNALFFELNWFEWLCRIGGVDPSAAAHAVPDDAWRASVAAATRSEKRYRRDQARFLVWRCLERHPKEVFGLTPQLAHELREALNSVLHDSEAAAIDSKVGKMPRVARPDYELLLFKSLWTEVERSGLFKLPAADGYQQVSDIHWRKILATVLSQYMRLSDTLIDLRCAESQSPVANKSMLELFMPWLGGGSPDASRLLRVWNDWCEHYQLIFSSAVGDLAPQEPRELARMNAFPFLTTIDPVVGVVGSSGGHKLAVCQFNTPGMPYVMVGTDTIREGVNLHLFCDRVMHYGLPWTAGDLEQRIGRVDRFFGRIERRLQGEGLSARLEIAYPHLRDTIEARQIEVLRQRRREVAQVLDEDFWSVQDGLQYIGEEMPLRGQPRARRAKG